MITLDLTLASYSNGNASVSIDLLHDGYFENIFYFRGVVDFNNIELLKDRITLKEFIENLNYEDEDCNIHFYEYSKQDLIKFLNLEDTQII